MVAGIPKTFTRLRICLSSTRGTKRSTRAKTEDGERQLVGEAIQLLVTWGTGAVRVGRG